jgi:hypothetical protein
MAMSDSESDVERRLREMGGAFIEVHDDTANVIREAANSGMTPAEICSVSGLSRESVAAFLRSTIGSGSTAPDR